MTASFGARLCQALDARGPLCVGIDPHRALLMDWGFGDDIAGLERFAGTVVAALADRVAVLKQQSAFFERFTRAVGLPPIEYLLAWRMAIAKDLLRREDMGLAEVANASATARRVPSAPRSADTWVALRVATLAKGGSASPV